MSKQAREIKQKARSKKVLFLINSNEYNTLHYVERMLDVSMIIRAEGISFSAEEEDVYRVFRKIETDAQMFEKLKLEPTYEIGVWTIDISLIDILVSYDEGIRRVSFDGNHLIEAKYKPEENR